MSTWKISSIPALLILAAALPAMAGEQASDVVVIQGATIIDGTGRPVIRDGAIVVGGGRIREIGRRRDVRVPSGAQTVDARGKWIIPGLIDAHVHFFQSAGIYTRPDVIDLRERRPYTQEIEWIKERLPSTFERYLRSGITGVVDVGGPMWNFEVRDIAARTRNAPHVAIAGPLVSTYVPPNLQQLADPPIILATTPEEARALVRRSSIENPISSRSGSSTALRTISSGRLKWLRPRSPKVKPTEFVSRSTPLNWIRLKPQ